MSASSGGGPAFPREDYQGGGGGQSGMTLRDHFAAKALAVVWEAYDKGYSGLDHDNFDSSALAKHAYQVADAMLAERSKS